MIDMWRGLRSACPVRAIVCGGGRSPWAMYGGVVSSCVWGIWVSGIGRSCLIVHKGLSPPCVVSGEAWLARHAHHHQ